MSYRKLFGTAICAFLLLVTSSALALDRNIPAAYSLFADNSEDSSKSFSEATDQSQCVGCYDANCAQSFCPSRWTASADFIILDRLGSVSQTLVERVPTTVPIHDLPVTFGPEALNANDFHQGFSGGYRLGLIRRGDSGYDLELSYFQIDGWDDSRTIGPDVPADWLVMRAPGSFLQTQDHTYQAMAWDYASRLYNAELNVRWNPCERLTMLAGFRWVNLWEDIQGFIVPAPDRAGPFWDTKTRNNLYGFQIGGDCKMIKRGRFSIDGLVKAGIYDNNAEETTGVSIYRTVYWESASTNHATFVGETGLQCKYQVTERLALKAGYQAIWLEGVALAPAQIPETLSQNTHPVNVQPLGVNCDGGAIYHGATAGLEFAF